MIKPKVETNGTNKVTITTRYGKYELVVNENNGSIDIREISGKSIYVAPKAGNSITLDNF